MTTKAQITKVASRDGVDAPVVERDYVLAHIVALISANDAEKGLIFKGGTSLRLLHVEDFRYSADLDYSVIKGTEAEGREVIQLQVKFAGLALPGPATREAALRVQQAMQ